MDNSRSASGSILGSIVFILIGLVMIFFGVLTVKDIQNVSEKKKIYTQKVAATADKVEKRTVSHKTGQNGISDTKDIYKTEFSYIVGKVRYKGRLEREIYTEKGSKFSVYVDPNDPSKWISLDSIKRQGERVATVVILCLLGVLLGGVGIYATVHNIKEKKRLKNTWA